MKLVDTNLLIYSVDQSSEHHTAARRFLEAAVASDETLALPWAVIIEFVRVSTGRRSTRRPVDSKTACEAVERWLSRPNVVALEPGPEHWRLLRELLEQVGTAGNLTVDAHLAALAIENGAELCSADSDFARFPRLKWTDPTRGG